VTRIEIIRTGIDHQQSLMTEELFLFHAVYGLYGQETKSEAPKAPEGLLKMPRQTERSLAVVL
jgi:hypothetical protein